MPTALIENWQSEAAKFAPTLNVYVHTGTDRVKDVGFYSEFDVLLSTYGVVRQDIGLLEGFFFHYVILDESENIKNHASKRARAVKSLKSAHRLTLTGTHIQNTVSEIWTQISFTNPGLLGTFAYDSKNTRL